MKKQFILLAVAGLVLTSCGIYTKYQRPEDITTDGLYGHDLDGQSLDSLSLFAASDTTSIASLSWRELFTDPQLQSLIEQALQGNTDLLSAQQRIKEAEATLMSAKLSYRLRLCSLRRVASAVSTIQKARGPIPALPRQVGKSIFLVS